MTISIVKQQVKGKYSNIGKRKREALSWISTWKLFIGKDKSFAGVLFQNNRLEVVCDSRGVWLYRYLDRLGRYVE